MTTKAKPKTKARKARGVSRDLQKFLKAAGVEMKEDVKLTPAIAEQLAPELGKKLLHGIQAQKRIDATKARDYQAEIKSMGVPVPKDFDTIEEFREHTPGFALVKASQTCEMKTYWGTKFKVKEGEEYCVTTSMYITVNRQSPLFFPSARKFVDHYKPYNGEDLTDKTLFCWREGGIGDLLFIRPIFVHLKKKYPSCNIVFATREQYYSMLELWGDAIDDLEPIPFASTETLDKADYHLTFMGVIEHIAEAERIDVHDLFARYAGLDPDEIDWAPRMPTPSKNKWFEAAPPKYAVLQASSTSPIRTPHTSTAVAAINAITATGMPCVIADRSQYARRIDDIISMCERQELVINFGRWADTIQDIVKLIDRASLVVAPDSAMVHIAAMQGTPSVGVYGPFGAHTRTARYPSCTTIEPEKSEACIFGGRHCFTHSNRQCEFFERCWDHLDNHKLAQIITEKLNATK
jgi:ADP-heptose:LPS heptosyltransferase